MAAFLIGVGAGSMNAKAWTGQEEKMPKATPSNAEEEPEEAEEKEAADGKKLGLANLQIPQKLAVVLDPWEMDGKGQIYSEQYIIQNAGNMSGVLTLSFTCRPGGDGSASVVTRREGLHDGEHKSLYIKIVFGNGEELCLSEEGAEYRIILDAGEELAVCFDGELNENASEPWEDGDIEIEGIYSWSNRKQYATPSNVGLG